MSLRDRIVFSRPQRGDILKYSGVLEHKKMGVFRSYPCPFYWQVGLIQDELMELDSLTRSTVETSWLAWSIVISHGKNPDATGSTVLQIAVRGVRKIFTIW